MTATRKSAVKAPKPYKLPAGSALVLRTCSADMLAHGGFVWPQAGGVATAADWAPTNECGAGLHGWLYGQGAHSAATYIDADAKWLVVEVVEAGIIMLGGKCKFQSGEVVFVGEKSKAAAYIIENEPQAKTEAVIGAILECGEDGVIQGGALSVLTGGNSAKMTGGNSATMTGGDNSVMHFTYFDGKRTRTIISYVGEDGIEPNVPYTLDTKNKVVKA